jgi:heat shock protein HslJ
MKNKKILLFNIVALVILGSAASYMTYLRSNNVTPPNDAGKSEVLSPKDTTYTIDGQQVTLVNGTSIVEVAPGSASKITTQYFGNEVSADFNGDGRQDVAFILTQNAGGSGTFYYVVVALNTENGYVGSDAVLLGDRIAPQTTEMSQNPNTPKVIVVNYADRKSGESFAVQPSVGKSIWLLLDPKTMQLGEVAQNFEGEADPNRMTLDMQTWNWIKTTYNNDTAVTPKMVNRFTITFNKDKTFSARTDCNSVSGEYILNSNKITFTKMMSTEMYCEGSQEQDFIKMLGEVQDYMFTSKGELVFGLSYDSGSMMFK